MCPSFNHAEVVTCVAGSLEAGGLPGYLEVLFVEINVMKSCQSFVALYFTPIIINNLVVLNFTRNAYMFKIMQDRNMVRLYR
jgi:hypothetical protein